MSKLDELKGDDGIYRCEQFCGGRQRALSAEHSALQARVAEISQTRDTAVDLHREMSNRVVALEAQLKTARAALDVAQHYIDVATDDQGTPEERDHARVLAFAKMAGDVALALAALGEQKR